MPCHTINLPQCDIKVPDIETKEFFKRPHNLRSGLNVIGECQFFEDIVVF